MKGKKLDYGLIFLLGLVPFGLGLFKQLTGDSTLSWAVLLVLGAGLLGLSMGELIKIRLLEKDPKLLRTLTIEAKDERNRVLQDRAKAQAFDFLTKAYAALFACWVLLDWSLGTLLLLISIYAVAFIVYLFSFHQLSRKI